MPLRDALAAMPGDEFVACVYELLRTRGTALRRAELGEQAEWGPHEENTAQLLDVRSHALDLMWAERITDPDDPEVKAQVARAKAEGRKLPPQPIIPPVAHRPAALARQRAETYSAQIRRWHDGEQDTGPVMSEAEFEAWTGFH